MKYVPKRPMEHESPEWVGPEAEYFITANAKLRGTDQFCHAVLATAIFDSIQYRNENHVWFCSLALLMPDHIHMIVNFGNAPSIARVMADWKRWLTKHHSISWQEDFFDHRLRNDESDRNKSDYILHNPVRAGLIAKADDWPYVWMPDQP